tara:strand:+ start:297 stop:479 length:183 start_codon:yes stop_codon:yes gene_type:complete
MAEGLSDWEMEQMFGKPNVRIKTFNCRECGKWNKYVSTRYNNSRVYCNDECRKAYYKVNK